MSKYQRLYTYKKIAPCHLECTIDLSQLFQTDVERKRFNAKWNDFVRSDPDNRNIYSKKGNLLKYKSEQLIPSKKDNRIPLLLVFGNPATHSVQSGMFFSFEGDGREHRFWKNILKSADVLTFPNKTGINIDQLNQERRQNMIQLKYDSPFRIGLTVLFSMPSAPGGKWGGVAGIQKLIGAKAIERLETEEAKRILKSAKHFLSNNGILVVFQKNAWNALKLEPDPSYSIDKARVGKLRGTFAYSA